MENLLSTPCLAVSSLCDAQARLSVPGVFNLFMDLAAEHAARLGVGFDDMRRSGCGWVAVRTRARFVRRPRLGERFTAVTWPGKPGFAKSDRYYRLEKDGELLAEGRTEWGVQDLDTGAIRRTDSCGYPSFEHRQEKVCAEPFTRFRPLEGGEVFPYTVGSMDIDMAGHMNNVAYIRMLLGTFSCAELAETDVREAEISYRRACFEGETLRIRRVREADRWLFQADRPDGETAIQALLLA